MNCNASFSKTARYFSKILHHIIEKNSSFHMNLVSRLAAAICAFGNHINFDIAKQSDTVISQNTQKIWLPCKTHYARTARYLWLILREQMEENITFQMNLVSHLAAADCTYGVGIETSMWLSILVRSYITNHTQITLTKNAIMYIYKHIYISEPKPVSLLYQ